MFFKINFYLIALILCVSSNAFAEINWVLGNGKISYRVNYWKNIPHVSDKDVKLIVTKFPNIEKGLFFNQEISDYKIKWNSRPFKKNIRIDKYSNEIVEAYFKPKRYKGKVNTISYEISFNAVLNTSLYELESVDTLPVEYWIFDQYQLQFLKNARGIQLSNALDIRKELKEILKKTKSQFQIVFLLTEWVKKNIKLQPLSKGLEDIYKTILMADYRPFFNSQDVYKNRTGSRLGRMNLLVALLRLWSVPTRVVKGLSMDSPIHIDGKKTESVDFTLFSKAGDTFWIEVFFPRLGWLPIDLDRESFFLFPNYITKRVGLDFLDLIEFERQKKPIIEEYFFEKKDSQSDFQIVAEWPFGQGLSFMPPVNTESLFNFFQHNNSLKSKNTDPYLPFIKGMEIESITLSTKKNLYYAQKIKATPGDTIRSIDISLFNLDHLSGSIEIQLYSQRDGQIGDLIAKSEKIPLDKLGLRYRFKWFKFKLKKPLIIDDKNQHFWLLPKLKGAGTVHWALHLDRNRGWIRDSYNISKDHTLLSLLNGDFSFRLNLDK